MWRMAEKNQEEHRALTPAGLTSQPEGCELRVRLFSQPHHSPSALIHGSEAEGSWIRANLAYSHNLRAKTTKRSNGTKSLAVMADLGGYNADRSWSTCNSTVFS